MGTLLAKLGALYGLKYGQNSSFCVFFYCDLLHVQSVIDLFAKQLNNALKLH